MTKAELHREIRITNHTIEQIKKVIGDPSGYKMTPTGIQDVAGTGLVGQIEQLQMVLGHLMRHLGLQYVEETTEFKGIRKAATHRSQTLRDTWNGKKTSKKRVTKKK